MYVQKTNTAKPLCSWNIRTPIKNVSNVILTVLSF